MISLIAIKIVPNSLIFYTQCRCATSSLKTGPALADESDRPVSPISGPRFPHRDYGERGYREPPGAKFRGRYLQREFTEYSGRGRQTRPSARDITFTRNNSSSLARRHRGNETRFRKTSEEHLEGRGVF